MSSVLCFVANDMADFEVTFAIHVLRSVGKRDIITVGKDLSPVISQAGFTYLPQRTLGQAVDLEDVEALILPGGPIRQQGDDLNRLILKLNSENKLLAAICFGPQHLGRAGILDNRRYTTSCSEDTIRSLQVPDPFPRKNYVEARVVRDGNVITSKGGAFVDFAFAVFDYLGVYCGRDAERQRFYNEVMNR